MPKPELFSVKLVFRTTNPVWNAEWIQTIHTAAVSVMKVTTAAILADLNGHLVITINDCAGARKGGQTKLSFADLSLFLSFICCTTRITCNLDTCCIFGQSISVTFIIPAYHMLKYSMKCVHVGTVCAHFGGYFNIQWWQHLSTSSDDKTLTPQTYWL